MDKERLGSGSDVNRADKLWNTLFISAFIVNMLIHLCQYAMNTLIAKYANHLNASNAAEIGFISSIYAVTALIFKIFSAPAIDTYNRKHILMGSVGVLCLAFTGYSLSSNLQMLMVSRALQGVGMAFTTACCLTIASDALPREKMGTGIAYFTLASAICQAIAPTFGLKLVEGIGYNLTFAVFAGILFLTILYISTMKIQFQKTHEFRISVRTIIAKEAILPASLIFFLNLTFSNVNTFLVLYADSMSIGTNISYFFTIYAATLFVTRPMIGKMADKYGTVRVVIPSMVCFAAAFFLISISRSLPMFYIAAFVSAFGYGGCQPAIQAACMKSVPRERRGAASTTSYIGTDLGHFLGPVIAGAVNDALGYSAMWRVMILPIVIAAVIALVNRKKLSGGETAG